MRHDVRPVYGPHHPVWRPLYGPYEPKRMLVRDLIKRLSAFDPDDEIVMDVEYELRPITNVRRRQRWEDERPVVVIE